MTSSSSRHSGRKESTVANSVAEVVRAEFEKFCGNAAALEEFYRQLLIAIFQGSDDSSSFAT